MLTKQFLKHGISLLQILAALTLPYLPLQGHLSFYPSHMYVCGSKNRHIGVSKTFQALVTILLLSFSRFPHSLSLSVG